MSLLVLLGRFRRAGLRRCRPLVGVARALALACVVAAATGKAVAATCGWPEDPRGSHVPAGPDDSVELGELGVPERRVVIALTDATPEEHLLTMDPVSLLVDMPLQHLGLIVRRWPVASGPPPDAWLAEARAILTWFGTRPVEPGEGAWVREWIMESALPAGLRIVVLGEPGLLERDRDGVVDTRLWAELVARIGLVESQEWCADPLRVVVEDLGPGLCACEAPVLAPIHRGVRVDGLFGRAWVTTRDRPDGRPIAPVVTGPFGGLALNPFVVTIGSDIGERRWHLELFAFLREALGVEGLPVFDPVVLNGRRLFFVQVDGDGFESVSTVRPGELAGSVFLHDVIDRFALPFTVSIIVASVTDALTPSRAGSIEDPRATLARDALTRANVEIASHGVLHPLQWNAPLRPDSPPRSVVWYQALAGYAYSPRAEVDDSVEFIDRMVQGSQRSVRTMLWTGDAVPPAEALAAARARGLANVNGGTYRWDSGTDSVGYVRPLVRFEGDELQVFCGAPNENLYEGFFDRHPGAFRHVATSLERTGAPRLLKPANVYVHFYAAERAERLRSVQGLLQRFGVDEPTAPVFASDWWGAAHDAFTDARVTRVAGGRASAAADDVTFAIRHYGRCRTLRFDDERRAVAFADSPGVLGARRIGAALYVHLCPEVEGTPTRVHLCAAPPPALQLEEANHIAHDARRESDRLSWRTASHAPRIAVVAGLAPGAPLTVLDAGRATEARADASGRYRLELAPGAGLVEVLAR